MSTDHLDDLFLAEATAIGDDLAARAVTWRGHTNWVARQTPEKIPREKSNLILPHAQTLDSSIYKGVTGIALFLGHLSRTTKDPAHWEVARGALLEGHRQMEARLTDPNGRCRDKHGFYAGAMGLAWTSYELAGILGETHLRERGAALLELVRDSKPDNVHTDVMGGAAGAIPTLLSLAEDHGVKGAREWAIALGEDLVRTSSTTPSGAIVWEQQVDGVTKPMLTGYSHGAAGFGLAFAYLGAATGEQAWIERAMRVIQYERETFDSVAGGWPDLRFPDVHPTPIQKIWCHGAGGIGIARAAMSGFVNDPHIYDEMRFARLALGRQTREKIDLPGANYQLCHGVAGNLECLRLIEEALGVKDAVGAARERALLDVRRFGTQARERWGTKFVDWPTGHPGHRELSLFLGIAGVGHYLLRLARPKTVPTIMLAGVSWKQAGPRPLTPIAEVTP